MRWPRRELGRRRTRSAPRGGRPDGRRGALRGRTTPRLRFNPPRTRSARAAAQACTAPPSAALAGAGGAGLADTLGPRAPPQRTRHLRTPLDKKGGLREEQEPDPVPASLAGDEAPAWPASLVSAASGRDHGPRRRQGPGKKRAGSGESARPAALTSLGRSRRGSADTRPEHRSRPGRPRRAARPGFALPEVPRAAGMFCYRIRQSSCRRPGRSRLCPAGRVQGGGWGHRCG